MQKLKGRTAFLTGAGRGLGRAAALYLSSLGVQVALNGRRLSLLEEVAGLIHGQDGQCLIVPGDISDPQQVSIAVHKTLKTFGSLEILVNNAAVIGPARFLEDADPASWKQAMDINVQGPCYCCHEVLPVMLQQRRGRIINLVSGLASMAFPRFCAYCASKAALLQMTRCLAAEFEGRPVQIMALDPGVMDTQMQAEIRSLGPEQLGPLQRQFLDMWEQGQLREPEQVAELVAVLAERDIASDSGRTFSLKDLGELSGE